MASSQLRSDLNPNKRCLSLHHVREEQEEQGKDRSSSTSRRNVTTSPYKNAIEMDSELYHHPPSMMSSTSSSFSSPPSSSSVSLSSSSCFQELEESIKRVRLSASPGELCLMRDLKDMVAQYGWTHPIGPYNHYGNNNDNVYECPIETIIPPEARSGDPRCRLTLHQRSANQLTLLVVATTDTATHFNGNVNGNGVPTSDSDASVSVSSSSSCCTTMMEERSNNLIHIQVDLRIPRMYPHQPPEVTNIQYHHHPTGSSTGSSRRTVDSILLVPQPPLSSTCDVEDTNADTAAASQDKMFFPPCISIAVARTTTTTRQNHNHHHHRHHKGSRGSESESESDRILLYLESYSPIHRLSHVLQRIATALVAYSHDDRKHYYPQTGTTRVEVSPPPALPIIDHNNHNQYHHPADRATERPYPQ